MNTFVLYFILYILVLCFILFFIVFISCFIYLKFYFIFLILIRSVAPGLARAGHLCAVSYEVPSSSTYPVPTYDEVEAAALSGNRPCSPLGQPQNEAFISAVATPVVPPDIICASDPPASNVG